jgi:hypothetical protein
MKKSTKGSRRYDMTCKKIFSEIDRPYFSHFLIQAKTEFPELLLRGIFSRTYNLQLS